MNGLLAIPPKQTLKIPGLTSASGQFQTPSNEAIMCYREDWLFILLYSLNIPVDQSVVVLRLYF